MNGAPLALRLYEATDEDAAIELWRRTWQQHYPQIDFAARVAWWRERWRSELVPVATIMLAERDGVLVGFVTVDPKTRYLDQIVVAPEAWGLKVNADNARAIHFYEKHGFVISGHELNERSGAPVHVMSWRP